MKHIIMHRTAVLISQTITDPKTSKEEFDRLNAFNARFGITQSYPSESGELIHVLIEQPLVPNDNK